MSEQSFPASLQKSMASTKVDYVRLGSSGLRVSWPILGTMTLGSSKAAPWVLDEEDSLKILKTAYDYGINTWDTSSHYSSGLSEEVIGKAIQKFNIPRQKLVLMTKIGVYVGEDIEVIGPLYADTLVQTKDYVNQGGVCFACRRRLTLVLDALLTTRRPIP